MRIVSLVPSLTELLFDLGLEDSIVGRTGFCIHPRERVRRVPKVGGTKTVDIERIRALEPTHLVVNIDENEKPTVDAIARFVPNVVVTHPLTVADNLSLYRTFGETFDCPDAAERLASALEHQIGAAGSLRAQVEPRSVVYLIWKDPWMTVSSDTYIADVLAQVGLRVEAPASARRYPEIDWTAFAAADRDFVLFSTEPYRFSESDLIEFAAMQRLAPARCRLVDGEMASWYGSRAIQGLRGMMDFRRELDAT